jgi:hypothetical protein
VEWYGRSSIDKPRLRMATALLEDRVTCMSPIMPHGA